MADLPQDTTDASLAFSSWDWENVLDFSIAIDSPGQPDGGIFPWHPEEPPASLGNEHVLLPSQDLEAHHETLSIGTQGDFLGDGPQAESQGAKRIRKRDPRLICPNFLAGRVPCACPEMEGNDEEEVSRKRSKLVTRCQVPSCEADIGHLKGYHRRHRVCLRCVNAETVMLNDLPQRYCQQCGNSSCASSLKNMCTTLDDSTRAVLLLPKHYEASSACKMTKDYLARLVAFVMLLLRFHLLPDFDEGKRSCRRKLERHNNRRRRKPADVAKASMQRQTSRAESLLQNGDGETHTDGRSGQESKSLSSHGTGEKQASSGRISEVEQPHKDFLPVDNVETRPINVDKVPRRSSPVNTSIEIEGEEYQYSNQGDGENFNDQNIRAVENSQASPSNISIVPRDGDDDSTHAGLNEQSYTGLLMEDNSHKDRFQHNANFGSLRRDEGAGPLKSSFSSTGYDNQLSYTSVCPTGRISFKLYDWNPAEFPRRLRQQILQWLASMPVELEGYIRPGCTILTAFIALPQFTWEKLSIDAAGSICNLVNGSESLLWGKGNMLVYLNDMVIQIEKGEASLLNIEMGQRVPRLYSVHPICFEAGRPIEIIACGKNLLQPKFRFLISFRGKYLHYDSCEVTPLRETTSTFGSKENILQASDHELCKIHIPSTDSKLFGPAFIEVENEYGISNFIPILIGDKQICSEFQMLRQELDESILCYRRKSQHMTVEKSVCKICRLNLVRHQSVLELLLDIGWVLKEPELDENEIPVNYVHIQRLNCLLSFLTKGRSVAVTKQILHAPKVLIILSKVSASSNEFNDVDINLLQNYVEQARLWISYSQPEYIEKTSFQQFSENVILQGLSSPLENTSTPADQVPCEESRERRVMECLSEIQAKPRSSTGLESHDSHILPVEENNILMPLLEKEYLNSVSGDVKQNSKWRIPKIVHIAGCTQKMKINLNGDLRVDRRIFILAITVLAICAGICVVLQHPHQVMEISMSLRRCLLGLQRNRKGALVP